MTTDRDIVEQARDYVEEKTDGCPILDPDSVHEILCDCADTITSLRKRLEQVDESAIEATVLRAEVERLTELARRIIVFWDNSGQSMSAADTVKLHGIAYAATELLGDLPMGTVDHEDVR